MIKRPIITSACRLKQTSDNSIGRASSIDEQEESSGPLIKNSSNTTRHLAVSIPMEAATRAEAPSPDYTFIARHLRAIVLKTDQDGRAREVDQDPYVFSTEELTQLIEHKKRTRFLDARVIVGNFELLVSQLHEERQSGVGAFPRRIQIAFKRAGLDEGGQEYDHWTAIDILLTRDCMNVFYLDSAGDPRNLSIIVDATTRHPDTELTLCEDIEVNGRSLAVQKDGESCSIFAIDNIFHMSKLPELHDHVNLYRVKDLSYEDKPIYCLDPGDLPAMLVRNAQSDRFMGRWMGRNTDKLEVAVDKKGHNIRDYLRIHSIFYPTIKKEINAGIQEKQIKYASRLNQLR